MLGLAAAAAATAAVLTFSPAAETAQVPTAVGTGQRATNTAVMTTTAAPQTTEPPSTVPATTVPASTTVPVTTAPPHSTSTTTTTTTTLPPLPASEPLSADSVNLGAFALGPLRFGSSGDYAAGRLVATFGQPDSRLTADESWGLCATATGRVLGWGGLSAIFRQDGDREFFVGYRYEGAPIDGSDDLQTISGLEPGMTLEAAQARYLSSVITTGTLEDGTAIFLLLRSSDRRTLLWGPVGGTDEAPTIEGIYSYRSCDRGPFAG